MDKLNAISQQSINLGSILSANEAKEIINNKDGSIKNSIHIILSILINQYGIGYDNLKTLSIIIENLKQDLELLNEVK